MWTPLALSLKVSLIATLIATMLGVGGGYLLAKTRFRGRWALEMLASLPIALPPTVVGYYLLTVVGLDGPLGQAWERLTGHPIVLTSTGCVVAATVECVPYCLRAARSAIEGVDHRLEMGARAAGMSERRVALVVTLPMAKRGIAAGIALGFARALGDFGATLAIAGNVPDRTQTMTTAVYSAFLHGDYHQANQLCLVLLATALVVLVCVGRLGRVRT